MLCIYRFGYVHSFFCCLQYREPVVGGDLASWWVGLLLVHFHLECFQLAFFCVRVVCKEGCIAPLPRRRKSGAVVT